MQQGAARGHGDHSQRVGHIFGRQCGAFQRIKCDIHRRAVARSHFFADVKHRCFIAFAFANHHDARDIQQVQLIAHGVNGGLIGGFFIAAPDQFGRGQSGGLGHAGQAQGQQAVLKFGNGGHGLSFCNGLGFA